MSRPLPPHPSTKQLKAQAKDLLRAHQAGDPEAVERAGAHLPRLSRASAEVRSAQFCLRDAQLVVAREYGFASWAKLAAALGGSAKTPCSFCGRIEGQVPRIVQGPGVRICEDCVRAGQEFVGQGDHPGWKTTLDQRCSFCGASPWRAQLATSGDDDRAICTTCLERGSEILEGRPEGRGSVAGSRSRPRSATAPCSVCARERPEALPHPLPGGELWLCGECVNACHQTLTEAPVGHWESSQRSTCSVCRRNASYDVELAVSQDGRVSLCQECAELLDSQAKGNSDKHEQERRARAWVRRLARQVAEKHQAGDPEAIRRVEAALPVLRRLSREELAQAPLDPDELYHVLFEELGAGEERRGDLEHAYVNSIQELESGPQPRRSHVDFLGDRAASLLDAHRQGRAQAARRIKAASPERRHVSLGDILTAPLSREEAREVVAREFGVESWDELLARDRIGGRHREIERDCRWLNHYAARITIDLGQRPMRSEHLLLALVRGFREMAAVLEVLDVDRQALDRTILEALRSASPTPDRPEHELFPLRDRLDTSAIRLAVELGDSGVHAAHLLLALIEEPESGAARIMRDYGVDYGRAREQIGRNRERLDVARSRAAADGVLREHQSAEATEVRKAAREEAEHLGHAAIDTEHLLLGILSQGDNRATSILTRLGVDLHALRNAIVDYVSQNRDAPAQRDAPSQAFGPVATDRLQHQVFQAAGCASREDQPPMAPPIPLEVEHLLLGLLKVEDGIAAQILAAWEVTYEAGLRELRALHAEESAGGPAE